MCYHFVNRCFSQGDIHMKKLAQRFRTSTFVLCFLTFIAMLIPKSILWCSYGYNEESVYTYRNYYSLTLFGCRAILFFFPILILNAKAITQRKNNTILHWFLCGIIYFTMYVFGLFMFAAQHCKNVSFIWQPFLPPILLACSMLTSLAASLCDRFSAKSQ